MNEKKFQRALEQIIEMDESRFTRANCGYDYGQVFLAAVEVAAQALGSIAERRVRRDIQSKEDQFIARLPRPGSIVTIDDVSVKVSMYDANHVWYQIKRILHGQIDWGKEKNMDVRQFATLLNQQKKEAANE